MSRPEDADLRINLFSWPDGYRALRTVEEALTDAGADLRLHALVALRVSQVNGCAYCIDMHSKDARALGETEQRLYALDAWHETDFFTDRERAALAFAEAVTRIETRVPDDVVAEAKRHFDDGELTKLLYGVALSNAWNRLAIASRPRVGSYTSPHAQTPARS